MDVTQALRDTENALRDFITGVLTQSQGLDWLDNSGVSVDRIEKWKERQVVERKRQETGVVDERLIYYADFYDLKTILKKHWQGEFSEALGEWKTLEVFLTELEKYRDPDAHRRELLPHQKDLISGIAGEIRTRLIRYRNKKETKEDCFPRIESARDSLGNLWTAQNGPSSIVHIAVTKMKLRPGDVVDFVVTARDPEDLELEYGIQIGSDDVKWQSNNNFSVTISQEMVAAHKIIRVFIKSPRPYHASGYFDDDVQFLYTILPPR